MLIFKKEKNKLIPINERKIDLEKDIQKITEDNLNTIFGLEFVSSEFPLKNFRIDTLAFDRETKSFVIIEYKRDRSFSVIDQGYAYLALMLNNKADFILEYKEKKQGALTRNDIDWSQSRVLFLANSFTIYQQNAINFKDLPIELWEVKKYDNATIVYNRLKPTGEKESIKAISKNKTIERISREVKAYSVDDHFKEGWKNSRDLFDNIREKILELDPKVKEKVNKYYIGYNIGVHRLCEITAYKSKIEVGLHRVDEKDLKDPENEVLKIPWRKWGWGKQCSYSIKNFDDIPYALFLIKQVYNKFYK